MVDDFTDLAVLLNQNARRVTARMQRSLERAWPRVRLYSARTLEEARGQIHDALERGCRRIVCGGGDGTIVHVLNQVRDYVERKNAQLAALGQEVRGYVDGQGERLAALGSEVRERFSRIDWPKIGILRLGTGNGFADAVGSGRPVATLQRLRENRALPTTSFHLVESEGRVFHFAGMGYDAAILNDYFLLKDRWGRGLLRPWFGTIFGYLTSILVKTIPDQIRRPDLPRVRITNGTGEVYRISRSAGMVRLADEPGAVLYEGPASVMGAATTPYYGFRLHAFPFAQARRGFFSLRVISAKVPELLRHAPSIFRGRYESPTFRDFLAQDVHVECDRPMPYQVGGDAQGYRDRVRWRLADFCVEVFDFQAA